MGFGDQNIFIQLPTLHLSLPYDIRIFHDQPEIQVWQWMGIF